MATKIRLQRHGKKGKPFYHVVAADARAKRDGKFIEKIGTYNPNTNPATINLNFDRALDWVKKGAQPTDTAKAILSYEGVLMKNHLDKGVAKGALKQADADKKFEAWKAEKAAKIQAKVDGLSAAAQKEAADRLAAEKAVNEARAAELAAKNSPLVEEVEAPVEEAASEETAAETTEEAPVAEAATEEVVEAPAAEEAPEEPAKEEAPAEEAPATEAAEEAPKAEAEEAAAEEGDKKEE